MARHRLEQGQGQTSCDSSSQDKSDGGAANGIQGGAVVTLKKRCIHDGDYCRFACQVDSCIKKWHGQELDKPWSPVERYEYQVELLWGGEDNTLRELFIICVGLSGEMGEVAELLIDDTVENQRQSMLLELGDVLFYYVKLLHRYEFTLNSILGMTVPTSSMETKNSQELFVYMSYNIGEMLELVKKEVRDSKSVVHMKLKWHAVCMVNCIKSMSHNFDSSLEEVMTMNIVKLEKKWKPKF